MSVCTLLKKNNSMCVVRDSYIVHHKPKSLSAFFKGISFQEYDQR